VLEKLKNDPKANQEVPSEWTKVCDDLIATKQAVFTLKTVKEICLRRGIVDGREVRLMLQKYHELGLAIYFDEGGLRDHVVMRPQHLIDLVKKLIFDRRLHRKLYKDQELAAKHGEKVDEFVNDGVIIHEVVLRHLWSCSKPLLTEGHNEESKVAADHFEKKRLYEYGRNILQKFMILCKIEGTDKYLVPSMMTYSVSREKKQHEVMGKFSLHFVRLRPHSYNDVLIGNIGNYGVISHRIRKDVTRRRTVQN